MKNLYYFIFVLVALLVSCNKQTNVLQEEGPEPIVLKAVWDDEFTKTTYTLNGDVYEFSWNEGDRVAVQVYTDGDNPTPDFLRFIAQSSGSSSILRQDGTHDLTPNHDAEGTWSYKTHLLGEYAFYPGAYNNGHFYYNKGTSFSDDYLTLQTSIPYDAESPTSIIPIIGKKHSGDGTPYTTFNFRTATGVLKFTLNNIPAGANKVTLTSHNTGDALSGYWYLTDDTYTNGIVMGVDVRNSTYNTKSLTFSSLDGQNVDFYVPIPVGTIHGLDIEILKDTNVVYSLYKMSTDAEIAMQRSVVTELPAIDCQAAKVTITGPATAPVLNKWFSPTTVKKLRIQITQSAEPDLSSFPSGFFFTDPRSPYTLTSWNGTGNLASSGKYYLHWLALSEDVQANALSGLDDARVKAYGSIPFYFISSADATAIAGTYNFTSLYAFTINNRSAWQDMTSNNSVYVANNYSDSHIKFAVSDDATQGAIMMTDFMGFGSDGVTNKSFTEQKIITDENNIWDPTGTYDTVSPIYGLYSGNVITLYCENAPLFVLNGVSYYLRRSNNTAELNFDYTSTGEVATMSYGSTWYAPCIVTSSQISACNGSYSGATCTILFSVPQVGGKTIPIATRNL